MHATERAVLNRTDHPAFLAMLDAAVASATRSRDLLALVILKVRNLETFNMSFGYGAGDSLLSAVGNRLDEGLGGRARVVRIGASRFAVLLEGIGNATHATLAGHKVERLLSDPLHVGDAEVPLNVAQGIAVFPDHAGSASDLLQQAEAALRHAVDHGLSLHSSDVDDREHNESARIDSVLAASLKSGNVETFFQPQVELQSGRAVGAEALLRCNDEAGRAIPPDVAILAAERLRLLNQVTFVVMNAAVRNCVEWRDALAVPSVSVNVSPATLKDPDLLGSVSNVLGFWGAAPENLTIEITESTFIEDPEQSLGVMSELRALGVRVAVDDFGTGYSSLSYFKDIPANELKIDRSFVTGMVENQSDQKLVRTIINLAHEFGLKVVAEGVENEAGLDLLRRFGCDIVQGYVYGRPMGAAEFRDWLARRNA